MDRKMLIATVVAVAVIAIAAALLLLPDSKADGITYDGNGGTFDGNGTLSTDSTTVGDAVPVRQGYDFLSWNTARDGSGDSFSSGDIIGSPVTLYAQWGSTLTYVKSADGPRIYDGLNPLGETKSLPAEGELTLGYMGKTFPTGVGFTGNSFAHYDNGVWIEWKAIVHSDSGVEPQAICYLDDGLYYIKIRYSGSFTLAFEESTVDYLVDDDDYARFSFDVQSDGTPETYRLIYSYTGKDGVLREYDYEMVPGGEYLVAGLSNTLGIKVVSSDTEWSSSSNNFSNAGKNIMFTCSTHPTSGGSLELKGGCPYFSFNYETYKIPSVTVVETSYVG